MLSVLFKMQTDNIYLFKSMYMNELIKKYIERGFGSMNKNDFEVAIFNEWIKAEGQNKSNYEISLALRIPEAKVKRLKYEAELKYGDNQDEILKTRLEDLLKNANFKTERNKLVFLIDNQMLRSYLDGKLKAKGCFSDRSFNSEIVSVNAKDFITLLKDDLKMSDDVIKKANNKSLEEALKGFGKTIVDWSLSALSIILTV